MIAFRSTSIRLLWSRVVADATRHAARRFPGFERPSYSHTAVARTGAPEPPECRVKILSHLRGQTVRGGAIPRNEDSAWALALLLLPCLLWRRLDVGLV